MNVPENDPVSHGGEQGVAVGVHRQNVIAVGILLQSFVDPVYKGHFLLLCRQRKYSSGSQTDGKIVFSSVT